MQVTLPTYHRLAKFVGSLLTLMGLGLTSIFAVFMWTGTSPLADATPGFDGVGLLILASIGAFTLPLGLSLFSTDAATSARLRIAGGALGLMALFRLAAFANAELRAVVGVTPLVEFFVLGLVGLLAYVVRPDTESAIELHMEVDIDVPASEAWELMAVRFADVCEFASGVQASTMDGEVGTGAVRACQTVPFGPFPSLTITEELTHFDPDRLQYAYVAGGDLPPLFRGSSNRWTIESLGPRRCKVRSHARIDLRWWALPLAKPLGWSMRGEVERFGEELRHRLETGENHPRKRGSKAS